MYYPFLFIRILAMPFLKRFNKGLCLILTFFFISINAYSQLKITITAPKSIIARYYSLLDSYQQSIEDISSLNTENAIRSNANLIILSKALKAGGLPVVFEFLETPNSARARTTLQNGKAVISSQDFFSITFSDDVFMSSGIIPKGEFVKGIYCLESNEELSNITTLEELKQFTGVSLPHWKVDWMTMEQLELKELIEVSKYGFLFNLIQKRGVDFTLLEFPNGEDLSQKFGDVTLIPVPKIMIALNDSRHFMISKQHPDGELVYEALEKGLAILREEGFIERIMSEVKVYRDDLSDWEILNEE